jgi:Mn2+/Fe2+ NRAMP family transporter
MAAIPEMCARIGLVTGSRLGSHTQKEISRKIFYLLASLLVKTSTINIGVDIGVMTSSIGMIFPQITFAFVSPAFTAFILG